LTGERTTPGVAAENYWFRRHVAAYRFAADRARGAVLDVGAGEGYGASILAESARVVAMELDPATARHASARYGSVTVVRGDACRLPFRARSFDAVIAMQVLEHLWCPQEFVGRAGELLRPGGRLLLSTPNRTTFSPEGARNPFHAHEYTAPEVEALLRRSFERVEVLGVHPGIYLRSLDVLAAGSLQHSLMATPFGELPSKLRIGVRMVRARQFRTGPAEGSLDLLAVASGPSPS
jgi:SAM-dependent methyltransferase